MEETVRLHTRGGTALAGVLHRPDGVPDDEAVPAVVLCQGLSGVSDVVLPDVAAAFGEAGLASLRFDYAGFGRSEGARGWIDPADRIVDAHHALAWLATRPGVDPARLGAYGHSYGGPVAVSLAARDRRVRAVVSVSGPGGGPALLASARTAWDWLAFVDDVDADRAAVATTGTGQAVPVTDLLPLSPTFEKAYAELMAGRQQDDGSAGGPAGTSTQVVGSGLGTSTFWLASADAMLAYHPEDDARRLAGVPLLLVNGEADDIATHDAVARLFDAAPGPKWWRRVPGAGHLELDTPPGLPRVARSAAAFFAEHLVAALSD